MQRRPTLLNSCALATTAAEARFRIDAPDGPPRATRVVALDDAATAIVSRVAEHEWADAHFFTYLATAPGDGSNGAGPDAVLRAADGSESRLSHELADADVAVMIAGGDSVGDAASVIGRACAVRGIMTAGVALVAGNIHDAISTLRPYAMVLLVSDDEDDVTELLTALRA